MLSFNEFGLLLVNGYQVGKTNLVLLGILLLQILGMISLVSILFFRNHPKKQDAFSSFSLGISLFIITCYLISLLTQVLDSDFDYLAYMFLALTISASVVGIGVVLQKNIQNIKFFKYYWVFIGFFFVFVLLKFSFLYDVNYPLYYDSITHYQIVSDLQNPAETPQSFYQIGTLFSKRYYHLGFHSIASVFAFPLVDNQISQRISILGHFFLLFFPITLGGAVAKIKKNAFLGILVTIFISIGWNMPSYAVNWGKYPAIASLAIIPLPVSSSQNLYHHEVDTLTCLLAY